MKDPRKVPLVKRLAWCVEWAASGDREFWITLPVAIALIVVGATVFPSSFWYIRMLFIGAGGALLGNNHIAPLYRAYRHGQRYDWP